MTPIETQSITILDRDLNIDEGTVPYAYTDSLGFLTIGRGILVDKRKGGKLYPNEIAFINQNRMAMVLAGIQSEPWYSAVSDNPARLAGIMNMQFQLGAGSDEQFPAAFAAIARRDWKAAGIALRNSAWHNTQTPARAERVIRMIETGTHS